MAERRVWMGSVGPMLYDDEEPIYDEEEVPIGYQSAIQYEDSEGVHHTLEEADEAALKANSRLDAAALTLTTATTTVMTGVTVTKNVDGFVTDVDPVTEEITYVTDVTLTIPAE